MLITNVKVGRVGLFLVALLLSPVIMFIFQAPAYAQCGIDWTCQTEDSAGDVGWFTSLAFDTGGKPAISYYDFTNDQRIVKIS